MGGAGADVALSTRDACCWRKMERRAQGLAQRTFTLPWLTVPPVGIAELSKLVGKPLVGW